jgi:hypothetical protein
MFKFDSGNSTYFNAAIGAGTFLLSNIKILDGTQGRETLNATKDASCAPDPSASPNIDLASLALFAEGLALLAERTVIDSVDVGTL